jgi:hypothetical protein
MACHLNSPPRIVFKFDLRMWHRRCKSHENTSAAYRMNHLSRLFIETPFANRRFQRGGDTCRIKLLIDNLRRVITLFPREVWYQSTFLINAVWQ